MPLERKARSHHPFCPVMGYLFPTPTVRGVRPSLLWNVGHGRKPRTLMTECQQGPGAPHATGLRRPPQSAIGYFHTWTPPDPAGGCSKVGGSTCTGLPTQTSLPRSPDTIFLAWEQRLGERQGDLLLSHRPGHQGCFFLQPRFPKETQSGGLSPRELLLTQLSPKLSHHCPSPNSGTRVQEPQCPASCLPAVIVQGGKYHVDDRGGGGEVGLHGGGLQVSRVTRN